MASIVKGRKKLPVTGSEAEHAQGRVAQRNRTRKAIVEAAMQLVAAGRTPSIAEIAEAAQVSRRTIYMYFPTVEQLLLDATAGVLSATTIDPVVAAAGSRDVGTAIEQLSRALSGVGERMLPLGRALIRLTVEAEEPKSGVPRRGHRRVGWIEKVLEPVRGQLGRKEFERLVSALSILMGWEALIVLKDVRGLQPKEVEETLAWAASALVDAALRGRRSAK
jgi:AcrR family transcriptional regulator